MGIRKKLPRDLNRLTPAETAVKKPARVKGSAASAPVAAMEARGAGRPGLMPPEIPGKRSLKQIAYDIKAIRLAVSLMMAESRALVLEHQKNIEDGDQSIARLIDLCTSLYTYWAIDLMDPAFHAQAKLATYRINALPADPPFVVIALHAFAPHSPELLRLTRDIGAALEYLHSQRESDVVVHERLTNEGIRHLASLGKTDSDVLPAKAPRAAEE